MKEKQEIRKKFKKMRDEMSPAQAADLSVCICENIITSRLFASVSLLYAYHPLGNEVDVRPAVLEAWRLGKRVAFPKVFGDEMRYFEVSSFEEFSKGAFGVMEPCTEHPVDWRSDRSALVLTPGVVFDRNGNRMGFGKGYYDRYFSGDHDCVLLGVAYELQMADQLPAGKLDVPLPWLVTENKLQNSKMFL